MAFHARVLASPLPKASPHEAKELLLDSLYKAAGSTRLSANAEPGSMAKCRQRV